MTRLNDRLTRLESQTAKGSATWRHQSALVLEVLAAKHNGSDTGPPKAALVASLEGRP